MWIRFWVALGLIAVTFTAGLLTLGRVERTCGDIERSITAALEAAPEDDTGQAEGAAIDLERAHGLWKDSLPLVCAFVIHDEVDVVSEAFHRALGHYEGGDWGEYRATLRELLFRIDIIAHYDRPTVRSVF